MPHRHAHYIERCAICDEPAGEHCTRCERPLCSDHVPGHDARCDACEADFGWRQEALVRPEPTPLVGVFRVGVLLPTAGMAGLGAILGLIISLISSAVGLSEAVLVVFFMALFFGMIGFFPTMLLYLVIGTPLFARRKLHGPLQKLRLWHERRRFLGESSAKKALADPGHGGESSQTDGSERPESDTESSAERSAK